MERDIDHVARIIEQWRVVRPDLDTSPMGIIGRLHRLAAFLDQELRIVFAEAGLSDGDFDILATIRRSAPPSRLTPSELSASSMLTSGAVTKRLDRLESSGYITRQPSSDDGRSRLVALTPAGRDLIDELVPLHLANERRLLAGLTEIEQTRLAGLLQSWGKSLDL